MSDGKNRTGGPPKPFDLYDVKESFPTKRPIFWGGEQDTINPDGYVEPNKLPDGLTLLRILQVIRFVAGGRQSNNPPPPITKFMTRVDPFAPPEVIIGFSSPSQNIQLQPFDFNINLGLPRFSLFWRIIEYKITQDTISSTPSVMTFHKIIKIGAFDSDGNVVGGGTSLNGDGDVIVPVNGDSPKQVGDVGSGLFAIDIFFTAQFSSDGVSWTTDPLSSTYPPVP